MKKLTVFGVIFAVILFGIYAAEAVQLLQPIFDNMNPIAGLDGALEMFWKSHPWWWTLCTVGTILCGVLAPILYFCKSVHSIECAYSAFGLDVLLFVLNFVFRYNWYAISSQDLVISAAMALLTLGFAGYLSSRKELTYHSSNTGWRFLGSK